MGVIGTFLYPTTILRRINLVQCVRDKMSGGDVIAYSDGGRRTVCPGQDINTKWKRDWKDKGFTVTVKCHTHK